MMRLAFLLTVSLFLTPAWSFEAAIAFQTDSETPQSVEQSAQPSSSGVKRALIACSLPGDEEHLVQFKQSVTKIRKALIESFGFEEENVRIQFGRNEEDPEFDDVATHGRATKEELLQEAKQLVAETLNGDTTWVFLIGHTYYNGKTVSLNIPDVDIEHDELTSSFDGLKGNATFFMCTPVSGFFIKGLSGADRVVITATEADWETNGSIFHTHLANTLASIQPTDAFDIDSDGKVTLVDLYIKATQDMVAFYLNGETPLYPTEHPNLDDNGDGRGSELQISYLTPEQGGQMGTGRRKQNFKDGKLAAQSALPFAKTAQD